VTIARVTAAPTRAATSTSRSPIYWQIVNA
jgi:hypothetical protein